MQGSERKVIRLSLSLLLAAQMLLSPLASMRSAQACGPFFEDTLFANYCHPNLPLSLYARGALGVVQPSYARSYQIVAFRYLSGRPLTAGEQKSYLDFWHNRLDGSGNAPQDDTRPAATWVKDRDKALGVNPKQVEVISTFRSPAPDGWATYLNCPADAFKTASATLARIVAKYGATSAVAKEWIAGQDLVFCHCSDPGYDYKNNKQKVEGDFPKKLPEAAPVDQRQDRQYQMAAAYFYAQKLDDALTLFTAISGDKTSPWQHIAEYMVARTLVRKGTLSKTKGVDKEFLAKAMVALKNLSADPSYAALKGSLSDLISFTSVRLDPGASCLALGKELANVSNAADLNRRLDDYVYVLDTAFNPDGDGDEDPGERTIKVDDPKLAAAMHEDELSDWIWMFSSKEAADKAHTAERFKTHHNLPWAVVMASKMNGSEPQTADVLGVLARPAKGDPAFVLASYHRARLLYGAKKDKEAEAVIAAALSTKDLSPSAANDLSFLLLAHAPDLETFFKLSFRSPALVVDGSDTQELPENFSKAEDALTYQKNAPVLLPKAAQAMNATFPLSLFVSGAFSKNVAPPYNKQFVQAAFTRAIMLKDFATAGKMTAAMRAAYPVLAKQMSDFEAAGTPEEREFAGVCAILKCPGMRPTLSGGTARGTAFEKIDDYQDNWWSKESLTGSGDRGGSMQDTTDKTPLPTPFLTAALRAQGKAENTKLQSLDMMPNYTGKIVLAFAKAHPADPRVPEALYLLVRTTRYGSSEESKTTAVSTQAFQILHRKYPTNPWTKKTPYHY